MDNIYDYVAWLAKTKRSPQSFEALLLEHGQTYEPTRRPKGMRKGRDTRRYMNAGRIALENKGYRYVEGYAVSSHGIPVQHGWLTDQEGKAAIETTWRDLGSSYFGIVLTHKELQFGILSGKSWGLFGFNGIGEKIVMARLEKAEG
jgi:hypothetical protein